VRCVKQGEETLNPERKTSERKGELIETYEKNGSSSKIKHSFVSHLKKRRTKTEWLMTLSDSGKYQIASSI
jgi:hypothetical protein